MSRSWNDPHLDIARKQAARDGLFLFAELDGLVVGTLTVGYDGHRGSVNYAGVSPANQRTAIGRALMSAAEHRLPARLPQDQSSGSGRPTSKQSSSNAVSGTRQAVDMGKRLIPD